MMMRSVSISLLQVHEVSNSYMYWFRYSFDVTSKLKRINSLQRTKHLNLYPANVSSIERFY